MKRKIVLGLVLALLLSFLCVLYVGAEPTTSPPAFLTGYTVYVPSGWSSYAGVGIFDLTGSFNGTDGLTSLAIGYDRINDSQVTPSRDSITISIDGSYQTSFFGEAFSFTVTGGGSVEDSNLINWLFDNNATFDNIPSPEPDPDPEPFPVAGGFYAYDIKPAQMPSIDSYADGSTLVYPVPAGSKLFLNEAYNVNRGTEIPIQGIVIQFANITDSNNYHIKVGVWYSEDVGFIPENVFTIVCTEGTFTKVNRFSFSRFYLSESVEFDEWGYQFFNAVFVPSDQPVPIFDGSPIAYIISSINDALRTDIFGTYSIMDMVTIFVSLSLLIWVLKMLAGG